MPPIPIYTNSPINASKASGVTPQTAAKGDDKPEAPTMAPATTTAAAAGLQLTRTIAYPPAQPGAVPSLPVPTGSARPPASGSPPAPQPGAAPVAAAPEPTAAPQYPPLAPPPQMSIPAPAAAFQQQHGGTSTTATTPLMPGAGAGLAQLPTGVAASSGAGATGQYQNPSVSSSPYAGQYQPYNGNNGGGGGYEEEEEGVWDSAKKYMQAAGSKLSAAESEVWRRINKH